MNPQDPPDGVSPYTDGLPAPMKTLLDALVPRADTWFSQQERRLQQQGRPLADSEIEIAKTMGVLHPESVRVVVLDPFPMPDEPVFRQAVVSLGLESSRACGFSMGYAILIKPGFEGSVGLLAHELVHVAQRERYGTTPFIRRYLTEICVVGYERSPIEQEARERSAVF